MLRLYAGNGYGPSMQACLPRIRFRGKTCAFWVAGWDLFSHSRSPYP